MGVLAIMMSGCHPKEKKHEETPELAVAGPLRKDTLVTREYVSQIRSVRHIELRALERGYLEQISVDEGQFVQKGQPMFRIMPNVYQADLQKVKAEAEIAEIEYQTTKALADQNVVSPNELALTKAKLDKAKAEVSLAETHLGFTQVRAPFSGIMDHLHVREGSLVDEGELLTTLSDNSSMWVYFNVPEAEYLDYVTGGSKKQQKVMLQLANGVIYEEMGVVETIEGEFDNETGNIAFRATFPNPKGILRHGQTGNILMLTPYRNALIIPQKATFEVLDKKYVFVVDKDHVIHQRQITIAEELPHLFILKDGLHDGEHILLDGLRKVRDGQKIEPNLQTPEKVFASLELHAE